MKIGYFFITCITITSYFTLTYFFIYAILQMVYV